MLEPLLTGHYMMEMVYVLRLVFEGTGGSLSVPLILGFRQDLLEKVKALSKVKVYLAATAAFHVGLMVRLRANIPSSAV